MAKFRSEPFVFISWGLLLFGWILMLAAVASLQEVCCYCTEGGRMPANILLFYCVTINS
jgi:hypothetical protein